MGIGNCSLNNASSLLFECVVNQCPFLILGSFREAMDLFVGMNHDVTSN